MTCIHVSRDACVTVTWRTYVCDVTYLYVWRHDCYTSAYTFSRAPLEIRHTFTTRVLNDLAVCATWCIAQYEKKSHVTHVNEACHTYGRVMSHLWMGHVTHMNGSCHTYERVMSHIWKSHVTHMKESCHTYERVMSHLWMGHVSHENGSCHNYEWVLSHTNASCHTYEWVMSHLWMSHVTHTARYLRPLARVWGGYDE